MSYKTLALEVEMMEAKLTETMIAWSTEMTERVLRGGNALMLGEDANPDQHPLGLVFSLSQGGLLLVMGQFSLSTRRVPTPVVQLDFAMVRGDDVCVAAFETYSDDSIRLVVTSSKVKLKALNAMIPFLRGEAPLPDDVEVSFDDLGLHEARMGVSLMVPVPTPLNLIDVPTMLGSLVRAQAALPEVNEALGVVFEYLQAREG